MRRTTHSRQAGDIDASEESWNTGCRLIEIAKPFKTCVRDWDARFLRIYGCVREVGGFPKVCLDVSRVREHIKADRPVSESTLKNEDFPTLGTPIAIVIDF